MKRVDLAAALGISVRMVSRLAKRGMPTDSLAAAKQWRASNLESTRTKQYRVDRNPGMSSPHGPGVSRLKQRGEWTIDAAMYISAAFFVEKFGIERFGPLLVHIGLQLSEESLDRVDLDEALPQAVQDASDSLSEQYFDWLPPGSAEAKELDRRSGVGHWADHD